MSGSGLDSKPRPPAFPPDGSEELLIKAFARLDPIALAVAVATLLGLAIFSATLLLVLKGGDPVGPNLALLGQYYPGYRVTAAGTLLGLLYGFVTGFILGGLTAILRNATLALYLRFVKKKAELSSLHDFLNHI